MSKKRKKPYYVVIDLYDLRATEILRSLSSVAGMTGMHRNSIEPETEGVYGHYLVLPKYIE